MLSPSQVKGVADRWLALWRSRSSSSIADLLREMISSLNSSIAALRDAPVTFDPTPATTEGGFRHQEWRISVNLDLSLGRKINVADKAGSLSLTDIATVGDTLYHEGRHAEQAFLVARKTAKDSGQRDPDLLARRLDIPVSIAKAAIAAGPPGKSDPRSDQIEEWAAFSPSGRHFDYWQWNEVMKKVTSDVLRPVLAKTPTTLDEFAAAADNINTKINILSTRWAFPYEKLEKLRNARAGGGVDADVLAQLQKITAAFDKLVVSIDVFRGSVDRLRLVAPRPGYAGKPDELEYRTLDCSGSWMGIVTAQLELYIAQGDAYARYPHELDASTAGGAAKRAILSRGQPPARRR
jgi:hypothetical protein